MKKILTVLLSFLMVATLGVVNVNTVSAEGTEEGIPVYGDSKIEVKRATNLSYNGNEQTVFTLKCVDRTDKDKGSTTATCHYKYAVSTDASPDKSDLDWKTSTASDKDKEIYVTAKDAGTYYLHVAMFKNDGSEDIQQYNTYGYNGSTSSMSVEIAKAKAPAVTINAPTSATDSNEEHDAFYFVTKESGTVALPFTKSADNGIETRWDEAVIKVAIGNNESEYPTNSDGNISFDKDNGKLTIKASESDDQITYVVTLKAHSDSSNYEKGEGTKIVKITKAKSDDFTIKFDELSTDSNGDVRFGLTGNEILDKISSVGLGDDAEESQYYQLAPKEGVTTITSKKIEKKNNSGDYTDDMKKSTILLGEHNLVNHSACDYDTLIDVAIENGYIKQEQRDALLSFRNHPEDESWINK